MVLGEVQKPVQHWLISMHASGCWQRGWAIGSMRGRRRGILSRATQEDVVMLVWGRICAEMVGVRVRTQEIDENVIADECVSADKQRLKFIN